MTAASRRRATLTALSAALAVGWTLAQARGQVATPPSPADPCAVSGGSLSRIEAVTEFGDIRLADGRLGRLADLDLGADAVSAGGWPAHLAAIRAMLAGLPARIDAGGGLPDRWGRLALRVSPEAAGAPSIHRRLVEAGLARVVPLGDEDACAASLLAVEANARAANLGLWREPAARLMPAGEPGAIRAMAGRFAIVQGVVVTVGERPRRVYLNFGRDFSRDFAATLSRRAARLLEKAGMAPSSLRGKTVRVRGMIAGRRAPAIEITSAGQIEVVR